jgi:hypothetical protein
MCDFEDIKNKESLRNCHNLEEPKKTWKIREPWYPRWEPETEEETNKKE